MLRAIDAGNDHYRARLLGWAGRGRLYGVGLTATALERSGSLVAAEQLGGDAEQALGKFGGAFREFGRIAHRGNVRFHILVGPAARMGDVGDCGMRFGGGIKLL
jgi:hypothetical protein